MPDTNDDDFLAKAAETQVDRLTKLVTTLTTAVRWNKRQIGFLYGVGAVLVAVIVALSIFSWKEYTLAQNVQQGAISQCRAGNAVRAADITVWDSFINLLLKGNPDPTAQAKGKAFKQYVAKIDASRNCSQVFGAGASAAGE